MSFASPMVLALVSVGLAVTAQFLLKAGMSASNVRQALNQSLSFEVLATVLLNPLVMVGLAVYSMGAVVWLLVLAKWDVSKAYPLVGIGFLFTLLAGIWAGEAVTWPRTLGVLLIAAGVAVVSRS